MLGSILRKLGEMIAHGGDREHALCGGLCRIIHWQTWASKARGTLQTPDVAPSIHVGCGPGGTPYSSLLPLWDKAGVLGPLLGILQFIHCTGGGGSGQSQDPGAGQTCVV